MSEIKFRWLILDHANSLKNASWEKILKLAVDNEEANIKLGRDGFGVHYSETIPWIRQMLDSF